jgi:hypothetical protein
VAGTICFLCSVLALNCFEQPLDPVAPAWDVNLTFPLAHRTYTLSEIVHRDTSLLRVGVGNQISYTTSMTTRPSYVGDFLSVSPGDTTVYFRLGKFAVRSTNVTIAASVPWIPQGQTVPIPDTTIQLADENILIPTFERLTCASGTIELTITNNLPVPLDITTPIELRGGEGQLLARFVFDPPAIPPSSAATAADDLTDKVFGNDILFTALNFHTPGSQTPVYIPTGDLIVFSLDTRDVVATSAVLAEIPPQRLVDASSSSFRVDDSTMIKEVRVASGMLNLLMTSRIDLDMTFKIRLPELRRPAGQSYVVFEDSVSIPPLGTVAMQLDLGNHLIIAQGIDLIRSLEAIGTVVLNGSAGQHVTLNDTDRVEVQITQLAPLAVDSAVGVVKPTWVDINTVVGMNFGDLPTRFSGQLNIPAANLVLGARSTFGFPMDLHLRLGARRGAAGDSAFIHVPVAERRIDDGDELVHFDAAEVGSFLSQFAGRLPDSIRVEGAILINPHDVYTPTLAGVGSIGRNSWFVGDVDVEVPLRLGVVGGMFSDTLAFGDTSGNGSPDYRPAKDRLNKVNNGRVFFEIHNGLPLAIGLRLGLLDSLEQVLLVVPQAGGQISAGAAGVDGQGNVVLPQSSSAIIEMDGSDVRMFNAAEHIVYDVSLETTPGVSAVRFRSTDFVRIRAWSQFSYKVNH